MLNIVSKVATSPVVKKTLSWAMKNSPAIATGTGLAMIGTGIYLMHKAEKKTTIDIQEMKPEEKPKTKVETAKKVWKNYIPPAIAFASGAAVIILGQSISLKRNAALIASCALSNKKLEEYEQSVIKELGPKKAEKVKAGADEEAIIKNPPASRENIIQVAPGDLLCMDYYTGRYFYANVDYVKDAVRQLDRTAAWTATWGIPFQDDLTLNDWYDELGLPHVPIGDAYGWDCGDRETSVEEKFRSCLYNDIPILIIELNAKPLKNDSYYACDDIPF